MDSPSDTKTGAGFFGEYPTIRTMLVFLGSRRWTLLAVAILGAVGSFSEGFGIGLLIPLLKTVLGQSHDAGDKALPFLSGVEAFLRPFPPLQAVGILGAGMVVLIGLKACLTFATSLLSARANGHVNDTVRRCLFQRLVRMDYEAFVRRDQAELVNAFETQTWRMLDAMLLLFDLVITSCAAAAIAVLLLLISWRLSLAVGIMAGGFGLLVGRPMTRWLNRMSNAVVSATAGITRRVLTILGGMRVVRAYGQENYEQSRFDGVSAEATRISVNIYMAQRLIPAVFEVAYVPIFVGAVALAQLTSVPVPTLLVFLLLISRLQPQLRSITYDYIFIASSASALLGIASLVDTRELGAAPDGSGKFKAFKEKIAFREVSFDFGESSDRRRALSSVSIEFHARQTTAIVGMSGSGKTTLINLLYGFYKPGSGDITVDGTPLHEFEIATWRAQLGLAGQDAPLLGGSLLDNLTYGHRGASRDEAERAARSVALQEFIESLPQGYDTEVGERGVKLSEGQRQRIGLARALLRDPDILILDEATSALDGLTERVVQNTLDELAHRKTLIVIAHRLSTVRKADWMIVLRDGQVVEQGPPRELLERDGTYALLHAAQIDTTETVNSTGPDEQPELSIV